MVRRPKPEDISSIAVMCNALWPDGTVEGHALELMPLLDGRPPGNLPAAVLVALDTDKHPIGFLHASLRSHADGCDPARAVGFIEGWYVEPGYRHRGVGTRLMRAAEQWAREQGCVEMASDTWLDNLESQHAHERLGFEIVDRCVHYRKNL